MNHPINLELRCSNTVSIGDELSVRLCAIGQNEPFCLLSAIIQWNPEHLRLIGAKGGTPWPPDGSPAGDGWMFRGFVDDSGLGGLNNTFDDGNCDYQAWADMSGFPEATPEGLVIDTLNFEPLIPVQDTKIDIISHVVHSNGEIYSKSAIYDEEYGGWNLLGARLGCRVEIKNKTATLQDLAALLSVYGKPSAEWDLDHDGVVGMADLAALLARIKQN